MKADHKRRLIRAIKKVGEDIKKIPDDIFCKEVESAEDTPLGRIVKELPPIVLKDNLIELEKEFEEQLARDNFHAKLKFGALVVLAVLFLFGMAVFLPMIGDSVRAALGV